jgi:hypothetical protein
MTLRFICAEIERLRLQIRGQQKETLTLQRSGISTASAELLLARTRASVDALCISRGQLVREPRIVPLCANDSDVIR